MLVTKAQSDCGNRVGDSGALLFANATPAAPLQTGKAYSVYLNARTSDASDPTRGRYFTKCCLAADVADAANSKRVVPLVPGTRAWWDEACDRGARCTRISRSINLCWILNIGWDVA